MATPAAGSQQFFVVNHFLHQSVSETPDRRRSDLQRCCDAFSSGLCLDATSFTVPTYRSIINATQRPNKTMNKQLLGRLAEVTLAAKPILFPQIAERVYCHDSDGARRHSDFEHRMHAGRTRLICSGLDDAASVARSVLSSRAIGDTATLREVS